LPGVEGACFQSSISISELQVQNNTRKTENMDIVALPDPGVQRAENRTHHDAPDEGLQVNSENREMTHLPARPRKSKVKKRERISFPSSLQAGMI
jgi:hypothetical protein